MTPKRVFAAIFCTTVLALSHPVAADDYLPGQFLALDLAGAVLSPKRLGPETRFAPVAVEARGDRQSDSAQAREPKAVRAVAVHSPRVAHARADTPRGAVRARLARRGGNPLDAQAFDTRVQAWPCKSGGICNWK